MSKIEVGKLPKYDEPFFKPGEFGKHHYLEPGAKLQHRASINQSRPNHKSPQNRAEREAEREAAIEEIQRRNKDAAEEVKYGTPAVGYVQNLRKKTNAPKRNLRTNLPPVVQQRRRLGPMDKPGPMYVKNPKFNPSELDDDISTVDLSKETNTDSSPESLDESKHAKIHPEKEEELQQIVQEQPKNDVNIRKTENCNVLMDNYIDGNCMNSESTDALQDLFEHQVFVPTRAKPQPQRSTRRQIHTKLTLNDYLSSFKKSDKEDLLTKFELYGIYPTTEINNSQLVESIIADYQKEKEKEEDDHAFGGQRKPSRKTRKSKKPRKTRRRSIVSKRRTKKSKRT